MIKSIIDRILKTWVEIYLWIPDKFTELVEAKELNARLGLQDN